MFEKLLKLTHLLPLGVVGKHVLMKPVTVQYPEERLSVSERFRGVHLYNSEKCIKCEACAKICPTKVIEIKSSKTPEGKKKFDEYNIYLGRCIFCGLCQDYCPAKGAIQLTSEYEASTYDKESLILDMQHLERKGRARE